MVIPVEAVEAAAEAAYGVGKIDAGVDWNELYPTLREVYTEMARAALEAAAPHIRRESYDAGVKQALAGVESIYKAEGWDEAAAWVAEGVTRLRRGPSSRPTPYRTAK